jgi:UDP-N-acetylglucosamine--N-acetylmuramyl-(pentapeptide) pyrophosphoryl-undecaprenol N-acetylglucosamine transferase
VPLPSAAEDHQTKNAMALVNKNAAVLVKEIDANNHLVNEAIDLIKQNEKLNQLSENAHCLSMPNSTHMIAIEVLKLANYNI